MYFVDTSQKAHSHLTVKFNGNNDQKEANDV